MAVALVFSQIWPDLWTFSGRRQLLARTLAWFSSPQNFVLPAVAVVHGLLYGIIIRHRYPDAATTGEGIRRALHLFFKDEDAETDGSEITHAFFILGLPLLCLGSATGIYSLLQEWLQIP